MNDITIILPTRNEEHNIRHFLSSIPSCAKLIVVDASEDCTPDLIMALKPDESTLLLHPVSVTEARQIGAEMAETPWLLFTDADVVFAPDYFNILLHYCGYDVVYGPKLSKDHFAAYYRWFARGQHLIDSLDIPAASGSNLLISRKAFKALGGFDLELTCNEDSELAWRARRNGYCTVFAQNLIVYAHDHRRLRRGVIRKTLHSLVRCAFLYFDLIPERWRSHDWGYWSHRDLNIESKRIQDGTK